MKIGKFEINVIDTGLFKLDGGAMFGLVPKPLWEKLYAPADESNRVKLTCNLMLINAGTRTILIDTGNGSKMNEKFRSRYDIDIKKSDLINNLKELDIDAASITDVILTHLHFDHSGGATTISNDGEIVPTFLNAVYHVQKEQFDWAVKSNAKEKSSFIDDNYIPLYKADRINFVSGEIELFPGITLIPVNGHTNAMQIVKIESEGESILHCGDLIPTSAHLPFNYTMAFDNFPLTVIEEKRKILTEAYNSKSMLFFEHDAYTKIVSIGLNEKNGNYKITNPVL